MNYIKIVSFIEYKSETGGFLYRNRKSSRINTYVSFGGLHFTDAVQLLNAYFEVYTVR